MKPPIHILFLLDHLHMNKCGVYALVRWTIVLMRKIELSNQSERKARITCSTYKVAKALDDSYSAFAELYDIKTLCPSTLGYPTRTNENELTLEDLNKHDKQYYRKLVDTEGHKLNDISHIVAVHPLTSECLEDDRIVQRLISINTWTKSRSKIRVLNFSPRLEFRVATELTSFAVGTNTKLHDTPETNKLETWEALLPTYEEYIIENKEKSLESTSNVVVLTCYSAEIHNNKFLERIAKAIDETLLVQVNIVIEWHIQWSYEETTEMDRHNLLQQIFQYCSSDKFKPSIVVNTMKSLKTCALCIQPGVIDIDGFSGLELLLAGIPTLVLEASPVYNILHHIDDSFSDDFTLYNSKDPTGYVNNIHKRLHNVGRSFKRACQFQNAYCKKSAEKGMQSTLATIQNYLHSLRDFEVDIKSLQDGKVTRLLPSVESDDIWEQELNRRGVIQPEPEEISHYLSSSTSAWEDVDETKLKTRDDPSFEFEQASVAGGIQTDFLDQQKRHRSSVLLHEKDIISRHGPKSKHKQPPMLQDIITPQHGSKSKEAASAIPPDNISEISSEASAIHDNKKIDGGTEIGIGAKAKPENPLPSFAEFLKTYKKPPKGTPRPPRNYTLTIIPPRNPNFRTEALDSD